MKLTAALFAVGCLALADGCATPTGLYRTQFDEWETKNVSHLGLSLELPKQSPNAGPVIKIFPSSQPGDKFVSIDMHRFWNTPFIRSYLRVGIFRLTQSRSQLFEKHEDGSGFEFLMVASSTNFPAFTTELVVKEISARKPSIPFLCFRKDYIAPNGDKVYVAGEILPSLNNDTNQHLEEDKKAVERILNSIRFSD